MSTQAPEDPKLTPNEPKKIVSSESRSPNWSLPTKIIVALLLLGGVIFLAVRFNNYLNLVLMAFLLSFLLNPAAELIHRNFKISWRVSVVIVYVITALIIGALIARGSTSVYGQVKNLVENLQANVGDLSAFLEKWSKRVIAVGPFKFVLPDLETQFSTSTFANQIQPLLGQAGTVAGKVVAWLGNALFKFAIVFMVSLFITSESEGVRGGAINLRIKGYDYDLKRMKKEISNIFNAFIRGEFTVVAVAIVIYTVWLGIMGVPYFWLGAIVAGLGRFVPYVGAWLGWITFIITSLLRTPPFGLTPVAYIAVILGVALVLDAFLDHALTPRVMSNALEVHPAAIMISALIGAQIFGLVGILLAAPAFASLKLLVRYIIRKIADEDPWEGMTYYRRPRKPVLFKMLEKSTKIIFQKIKIFFENLSKKLGTRKKNPKEKSSPETQNK